MGDGGHDFASATGGQIRKNEINNRPANVGESIAVEEKERGTAMALPQEFYGFGEGEDCGLPLPPLCFKRSVAR
jgi:hypothetical protein